MPSGLRTCLSRSCVVCQSFAVLCGQNEATGTAHSYPVSSLSPGFSPTSAGVRHALRSSLSWSLSPSSGPNVGLSANGHPAGSEPHQARPGIDLASGGASRVAAAPRRSRSCCGRRGNWPFIAVNYALRIGAEQAHAGQVRPTETEARTEDIASGPGGREQDNDTRGRRLR